MEWKSGSKLKWDEQQLLGRGCQGTVVYSGFFHSEPVAVKRVILQKDVLQRQQRELDALLQFRHPYVVQLVHAQLDTVFL